VTSGIICSVLAPGPLESGVPLSPRKAFDEMDKEGVGLIGAFGALDDI